MVITAYVKQAYKNKREMMPTLKPIEVLPEQLEVVQTLIADNDLRSQANVLACAQAGIEPLLAIKRQAHHAPLMERFAPDPKMPQMSDPLAQLSTQAEVPVQTTQEDRGASVWHPLAGDGLTPAENARTA